MAMVDTPEGRGMEWTIARIGHETSLQFKEYKGCFYTCTCGWESHATSNGSPSEMFLALRVEALEHVVAKLQDMVCAVK